MSTTNTIEVIPSHARGLTPLGKIPFTVSSSASPKKSPIRTPDIVQCQNIFDLLNDDNLPSDSDTASDSVPLTERKNSTISQPETLILSPSTSSENYASPVRTPYNIPLTGSMSKANIKARYVVHSPTTYPSTVQPSPMHFSYISREKPEQRPKDSLKDPEKLAFTKACYYVEKDGTPGDYGVCNKKGCTFAHTLQELRVPKCRYSRERPDPNGGYSDTCKHGKNCYYIHANESIQNYYRRIGKSVPNLPTGVETIIKPSVTTQSPIPSIQFSSPPKQLAILPSLKEETEPSFHESRTSSSPQEKVHDETDKEIDKETANSCTESHASVEPDNTGNVSTIHVPIEYLEKVLNIIKNKKYTGVDIRIS